MHKSIEVEEIKERPFFKWRVSQKLGDKWLVRLAFAGVSLLKDETRLANQAITFKSK